MQHARGPPLRCPVSHTRGLGASFFVLPPRCDHKAPAVVSIAVTTAVCADVSGAGMFNTEASGHMFHVVLHTHVWTHTHTHTDTDALGQGLHVDMYVTVYGHWTREKHGGEQGTGAADNK